MREVEFVELTWLRTLKVWWSLLWRNLLFSTLAAASIGSILGFFMGLIKINPQIVKIVTIFFGYISLLIVSIMVTRSVLNKDYSDFRIALIIE